MRKRKTDARKKAAKKAQPARKSAAKSSPATTSEAVTESMTPTIVETKRVAAMRANQMKKSQTTPPIDSNPGQPSGEEIEVSPSKKVNKPTKSYVRRAPLKTKPVASCKFVSSQMGELDEGVQEKVKKLSEVVEVSKVAEVIEEDDSQHTVENTKDSANVIKANEPEVKNMGGLGAKQQSVSTELGVTCSENDANALDKENNNEEWGKEVTEPVTGMDEEKVYLGENEDENLLENVDVDDRAEGTKTLQEEERELKAIAKERKNRKECEVFVGGLDRDATENDVRRVFEKMGDIVNIRLNKSLLTTKNKGYAFVEYAKKEHAKQALAEMKNPVIHGKRCGTAPSDDNDTLFLGNICNTWTKEEVSQKLKGYGLEGLMNITLVPDLQREGLSRGFAFVEFTSHADAMSAYKRLQKPDVILGHTERTAKVAFSEPLREPDPNVMAQIKSVFVDGLPPHWDEVRIRDKLKGYGNIIRVCLARNMSTPKRKDFGFVDFSTHEAAIACIDGINNNQLNDGNSKAILKARLSNPLPKTQAVKGGMCGGFRIGHSDGSFPRPGRGSGRGGNPFNNSGFPRDRGFHHGGRSQTGRINFPDEYGSDNPYSNFHGRHMVGPGGRRGSFRGGSYPAGGVGRPYLDRQWYGAPDRELRMHYHPRWQPHSPGVHFDEPFPGNHFDDPYFYGDGMHGMKRTSYMRDYDPDFVEPSRIRPRLDYTDPAASFYGNPYHDGYEAGSSLHSQDYYGPGPGHGLDYAGGPHSSFYGGDHHHTPYGRGGYYF